jgi:zeaxanthin glucosyltransferase
MVSRKPFSINQFLGKLGNQLQKESERMQTVIFLAPGLTGHLNPTATLAKHYAGSGCSVFYCGTPDLMLFTQKQGFQFYALNSLPFASGFDDILHDSQKEKWLESLLDRHADKLYKLRKSAIEKLINDLNPDLIFLDEFNYSDFVLLHPFLENRRVVMLQTKFPMYYSETVPPLNTHAFPGKTAAALWKKYLSGKKRGQFWDYVRYFGKDDLTLMKQKWKAQRIPEHFVINTNKTFKPTFKNVEEWFLVPPELDFSEQTLLPWQRYIGPMVDIERNENLEPLYLNFIEKQQNKKGGKLIYCSLGTVLQSHLRHRKGGAATFFNNLIHIAEENPDLLFVVALEKSMRTNLKTAPWNFLLLDYAPQIDILKRADVFLTHAGAGSIFESIFCALPMIVIPLNDKWDQNGNAARVVHQGLGIKADLSDSRQDILKAIRIISDDKKYKDQAKILSQIFEEKYHGNYLGKLLPFERNTNLLYFKDLY